eukprot:44923_1
MSLNKSDCTWNPTIPNGHTSYSWNSIVLTPTEHKSISITESKQSSTNIITHLRSSNNINKLKQNMKPLTTNMFICKFCQHTLQKKSACFIPKCYYWSRPAQTTDSSKHHTICHRNISYNTKNNSNEINDDRSKWDRFKGVISYDGYDFHGWQSQLNASTIQDLLEWRLSVYFKCKINVIGCSRTDAKVHANNQAFHCDLPIYKDKQLGLICADNGYNEVCLFIQKILNSLPKCLHIKSIQYVDKKFHSRFCCFGKTYIYYIIQKERCKPSERRYCWNINENNRKILNIKNMIIASKILIGKHNFNAIAVYCDKNRGHKGETFNPVKDMKQIKIITTNNGKNIEIHMTSSGFLYKMARSIVGTLVEIGFDNLSIKEFECIFKSQKRTKNIVTAPGHGLTCDQIYYDKQIWDQISNQ